MTVSLSIFQQLCPACATSIPVNATRCECGHDLAGEQTPLENTLRDEELYENYLAARAEQAHETAQIADRNLAEDPADDQLAEAATLAHEVAGSIAADLAEQRRKVRKLRSLLPPPSLPPLETPAKPAAPVVTVKPVELPRAPVMEQPAIVAAPVITAVSEAVEPPAILLTPTPITVKTPIVEAAPAPAPVVATSGSSQHKAANALSALKQAKAREGAQQLAALRAQIARQKKIQQEEAEHRAAAAAEQTRIVTPPPVFREEQAARAERVVQERLAANVKECPNCTSSVPLNATRCQCGFAFVANETELPSLTLCTGDFTALRNSFFADLRSRR